jgi:hypothetical protein
VTTWSLNRRGWSPESTCAEYAKLQQVAEALVTSLSGATSPIQFTEAQKSLIFHFQELLQRKDPLHPRFPGGHRCLEHCYLEYAMKLRIQTIRQLQQESSQPEAPPVPPPQPLSDEELLERLKEYVKERSKETFFGQDQEVEAEEESA